MRLLLVADTPEMALRADGHAVDHAPDTATAAAVMVVTDHAW